MKAESWSFLDSMWRWASFTMDASWAQAGGRASIARLQADRLSRLIGWTARHSRFYAAHWGKTAHRDLRLTDLPPVHKAQLMAHFDDWVTDPAVTLRGVEEFISDRARVGQPFLGRYAVFSSSGTTGVPGLIVHDGDALAVYDALGAVRMGSLAPAWNWNDPLSGHRYALIAATEGHFAGVVGWERLRALHPWFEANARVFPVTAPIREICAELDRFKPTVVASYATVLRALAHEKDAGRLAITPSVLWYGGEWLAPMTRDHIERAFACRVAGDYGASEFLNIAFECEKGSLHVNDDWVVLEPVDEHYAPVPPDTPSASVLLTNLANRVQPLIRYELGDSVTCVSKPCGCGRLFPVIRIDGRRDEILRLHDLKGHEVPVMPMALCTAVEEGSEVHRFQVVQTGPRALRVRLEPASHSRDAAARVKESLVRFLACQGLARISMRMETGQIAAHPVSGKFRQVWREKTHHTA
ncbi:MAG: phenylacetate--CoA ligase family protein [Betaproteobacteria bacterium]|nr:phenylacetate--CoA ligase family protein [Betaproteobacteria bacterium]